MPITYAPIPPYQGQPSISSTIGSSASQYPNSMIAKKNRDGSWTVDVLIDGKVVNRLHIPTGYCAEKKSD